MVIKKLIGYNYRKIQNSSFTLKHEENILKYIYSVNANSSHSPNSLVTSK